MTTQKVEIQNLTHTLIQTDLKTWSNVQEVRIYPFGVGMYVYNESQWN